MKRFLKILFLIPVVLCGCGKRSQIPVSRIVTSVDITCQHEDVRIARHYTKSPKMEYVLYYLRLLEPDEKLLTEPEFINEEVFEITVSLSDGTREIYRQKAHRYISKNGRSWRAIDPEKAAGLYKLMANIPSDV